MAHSETKNLPTTEHWAALIDESFTTDSGYGHNGQADLVTTSYMSYQAFRSEEEMLKWVEDKKRWPSSKSFRIIYVKPAQIKVSVSVSVE